MFFLLHKNTRREEVAHKEVVKLTGKKAKKEEEEEEEEEYHIMHIATPDYRLAKSSAKYLKSEIPVHVKTVLCCLC